MRAKILRVVLCVVAAVLVLAAGWGVVLLVQDVRAGAWEAHRPVDTVLFEDDGAGSFTYLAMAAAGEQFVVAVSGRNSSGGLFTQARSLLPSPGPSRELQFVSEPDGVTTGDGILLFDEGHDVLRLNASGDPEGPAIQLGEPGAPRLPGIYPAYAVTEHTIAVARSGPDSVYFQIYRLTGEPATGVLTISSSAYTYVVRIAQLGDGRYLLAWTTTEDGQQIVTAVVDAQGQLGADLRVVYTGSAPHCCSVSRMANGNALVVFDDHFLGRRRVFALEVDANGPVGAAQQLGYMWGRGDDGLPQAVFNGRENVVAWYTGYEYGNLARTIAVRVLGPTAQIRSFDFPTGIYAFRLAATRESVALAASGYELDRRTGGEMHVTDRSQTDAIVVAMASLR